MEPDYSSYARTIASFQRALWSRALGGAQGVLPGLVLVLILWGCGTGGREEVRRYGDLHARVMELAEAAERERALARTRWSSISDLTSLVEQIQKDLARGIPPEEVERNVLAAERFARAYELQFRLSVDPAAYRSIDRIIHLYTEAIELDEDCAEAYDNRAEAYLVKGDFARAMQDLRTAIALKPELASAYNGLGNIYHLEMDFDQAIDYYTRAVELCWEFAVAWANRGDAHMAMGDRGRAERDFRVACELGYPPACRELFNLKDLGK